MFDVSFSLEFKTRGEEEEKILSEKAVFMKYKLYEQKSNFMNDSYPEMSCLTWQKLQKEMCEERRLKHKAL